MTQHKRGHAGKGVRKSRREIKSVEVTALFVKWGIIGELPEIKPTPIVLGPGT